MTYVKRILSFDINKVMSLSLQRQQEKEIDE
jgi:hypothetical protein